MNIGRLKLKPKGATNKNASSSTSNSPSSPMAAAESSTSSSRPVLRLPETKNSATSKSSAASLSRSEPSVRFKLEDEILGSLSASSSSGGGSNNEDSLEIMEEIETQDDGSSSISENVPLTAGRPKTATASGSSSSKKRQLFDIDDEPDLVLSGAAGKFDIDELQLSGDQIAQHFHPVESDDEVSEQVGDFDVKLANKKKLMQQNHDVDSLEQILNDIESPEEVTNKSCEDSEKVSAAQQVLKELSPLNDDDVLINNSKVSLNLLKKLQKQSHVHDNSGDNSLNTTNDISELARDTESDRVNSEPKDSDKMSSSEGSVSLARSKSVDGSRQSESRVDGKPAFASLGALKLEEVDTSNQRDQCGEEDNSVEEIIMSNHSIVASISANEASSFGEKAVDSEFDKSKEVRDRQNSPDSNGSNDLKEKILTSSKSFEEVKSQHELEVLSDKLEDDKSTVVKQMEKVTEFKEALEDISEESEPTPTNSGSRTNTDDEQSKPPFVVLEKGKEMRRILDENIFQRQLSIGSTIYEDNKENIPESLSLNKSLDFDSVVSLNMFQAMQLEVKELREIIANKEADSFSRRESLKEPRQDSFKDHQRSDSNSLATNSTEYRPLNDEPPTQKDLSSNVYRWVEILAEKLQESLQDRDRLQTEVDKQSEEINQIRKQLTENVEAIRGKPHWMRDQESTGQRISEISIDLVSETDDALSDFPDMYEERSNRNSRERQLDLNLDIDYSEQNPLHIPTPMSKQFEQFRKYLSPDELRLFNMVQGKFDDYLNLEMHKLKVTHEDESKILQERLDSEKNEREAEVGRLRQMLANVKCGSTEIVDLRNELEARHTQEMADLRTYFEKKCAELEKHYSEEVFSLQSRRVSNDTVSDISDQEEFPEENGGYQSKHNSPKRKLKEELYLSPTHHQITPTTIDTAEGSADEVMEVVTEVEKETQLNPDELKKFYKTKMSDLRRKHDADVKLLQERLKYFEDKEANEEFIINNEALVTRKDASHLTNQATPPIPSQGGSSSQTGVLLTAAACANTAIVTSTNNLNNTATTTTTTADIGTEPSDDLHEIISDYERRLQEQVALARQDVLRELEVQIQALLTDTVVEDSHWPPELVLLREKFTAKSQLEIAQLEIKHEEEMAKVKADFEKQLQWKLKRQSTFDSTRDLDKIISERDNLRELSSTLRSVLGELVKYVTVCEDDLNNTVIGELQKHGILTGAGDETLECSALDLNETGVSTCSTRKFRKFAPDVSGLASIIEDPSLLEYVSKEETGNHSLNLDECLERLRSEAVHLLTLSEKIARKPDTKDEDLDKASIKSDSCEEEDGLKRVSNRKEGASARSFDDNMIREVDAVGKQQIATSSLPVDLANVQSSGELNIQLHELRNRLLKTEDEKRLLESELAETLSKHNSLVVELNETKQHLLELNSQRVEFSEGYGTNALLPCALRPSNSFVELLDRSKHLLSSAGPDSTVDSSANLLQLVEDFCREGERYMDDGKREKVDLQSQIEAADKQLKATRQFLEDQAAEREHERDEFVKEISRLKTQLREKDKDKVSFERATKEEGFLCDSCSCDIDNREIIVKLEAAEQHTKDLGGQLADRDERIRKLENDLKDSIDKGFTLREIITELETQIDSKSVNEHVLDVKIKELEQYISAQNRQNESLHQEMESMKTDIAVRGYDDKIAKLEEEIRQSRPSVEQSLVLEALTVQLRDIEETLERKTKNLETLHSNSAASLVCSSPSEDISMNQDSPLHRKKSNESSASGAVQTPPLPVDEVQRIFDKLHRHTRVEEVAIKRINDLEMQIGSVRTSYAELQHERDVLQERMSEQSLKITTLQSKLDEQRMRAEELHRQGTSHLTVRVHDLQEELVNLRETLHTRDKQIDNLKNFLENSRQVIERQEKELAMTQASNDRSQFEIKLETELKAKCDEIQQLKNKIQNEMINKVALPDLMETMLADKNEEIDQLRDKLSQLQSQPLPQPATLGGGKDDDNARTLSDIVSITDCDESDMVMRRMPEQGESFFPPPHSIPMDTSNYMFHSKDPLQTTAVTTTTKRSPAQDSSPLLGSAPHPQLPLPPFFAPTFDGHFFQDLSAAFPRPTTSAGTSSGTPEFLPRQINFSLVDSAESRDRFREPAFIEEIREDESGGKAIEEEKRLSDITENPTGEDKGKLENELESLKLNLDRVTTEKDEAVKKLLVDIQEKVDQIADLQVELAARNKMYEDLLQERKDLKAELEKVKANLKELEPLSIIIEQKENAIKEVIEKLSLKEQELAEVNQLRTQLNEELEEYTKESASLKSEQQKNQLLLSTLKQQIESLNKTIGHKDELMSKLEKDILNYSKNEEKYLEQLKSLDAKDTELKIMQGNYKDRLHDIEILNEDNRFLNEDINRLKNEIAKTSSATAASNVSYVQFLKQNCEKFEEELRETKVLLTEKMLALERVRIELTSSQQEVEDLKTQLKENETIMQQIGDDGNSLHEALSSIQNRMQENSVNLNKKLREEQERNLALQTEIERLKSQLQRSDNSSSPKPFSVEEIAEQLEKELNYSAQLDSSIMKAIESDDVNSEDDVFGKRETGKQHIQNELEELRQQLQMEVDKGAKLRELLEAEKHNSNAIQMQDAEIIEAMRLRLEAAIDNEGTLQKMLAEEKNKNDRLSTLVAGVQRTKSFDNYLLMKTKSPHESPSRRLNRSNEFESEMVARLESEIKFLTAQNERERERAADSQRVLERERNRFEKEISDRNEHGEQVKKELIRVTKEKERLEVELDHEQEKLMLSHREIESLEKRISALQEAESMRSIRRDRVSGANSLEFQELRSRLDNVEQERNLLQEAVQSLRSEVERRKHREAKLTEALSKENSLLEAGQGSVPEEFLTKLKDLNRMLESNARENHQQAETLRLMMDERKTLQQRIQELERYSIHGPNNNQYNRDDLEERANHLFGKYLRSESHRKALVHQKRYLQIVLATNEENELKALQLLNAQGLSSNSLEPNHPRRRSFRAVVTAIVAIERMKFIVRKWQGGRRVCAKAIFSQQFTPRRTQSASTNVWARSPNSHFAEYSVPSPAVRDRPQGQLYSGHYLRLPESQLLMNGDLREKLEEQYNRSNVNR